MSEDKVRIYNPKPKKQHSLNEVMNAPFDMMDYTKSQDQLVIEYREKELALLSEILKELKIVRGKIK